jgi:hypothetical protein|tara:strand:- start:152 stop:322 length:171 start_codon:yes stop_codon:yes gene_type:complete
MEAIENVSHVAEEKKTAIINTMDSGGNVSSKNVSAVAIMPTDRPSVQASAVHVIQK